MNHQKYTKFEIARLIGARALQLAMGAPPMIELPEGVFEPSAIAKIEFEKNVIPIVVYKKD